MSGGGFLNNNQAVGYTVLAIYRSLEDKNFKEKKSLIDKVITEMYHLFDIKTEKEAYNIGNIIELADSEKELKKLLNKYYDKQPVKVVNSKRIK